MRVCITALFLIPFFALAMFDGKDFAGGNQVCEVKADICYGKASKKGQKLVLTPKRYAPT
jgi:hypothetical protein